MIGNTLYFLSFIAFTNLVFSFNLDYEYSVLKTGPEGSLFGFSVAEHQERNNNWIIAGAPKAVNKYLQVSWSKDNTSGTVFKCNASEPSFNCTEQIMFDNNPSTSSESKTNEWLGVSLESQGRDKSVMSCAHRYEYYGKSRQFRLLEGQCYQVDATLSYEETYYNPCRSYNNDRSSTPGHERYGQCQTGIGFSMNPKYDSDGNIKVILGSVGAKDWTGRLFQADSDGKQNETPLTEDKYYQDSYFGYSVALGKFYSSSSKSDFASGGPRHESYGTVIVHRSDAKGFYQQLPEKNSRGEMQIASGFGISLCAVDSNSDGVDELVIGAPFYAPKGSKDRPDNGIVYIYHQPEGQDKLVLQKKIIGEKKYSQFGYAVANAGDLNRDGYNDLVVGAPRENGNAGAVYVFQGSNIGLLTEKSQHIPASTIHSGLTDNIGLKGFGRSLAGGLDLDNNGFNDVLVGAFMSNQVVLLRSRPVIRTASSMEFSPTEVNITDKDCFVNNKYTNCFKLRFCYNFSDLSSVLDIKQKNVSVKYTIIADPIRKPRVNFAETFNNVYSFYVKSSVQTKCKDIEKMHLIFNEDGGIAEYPDLTFVVKHELPYGDGLNEIPKPNRSSEYIPSLDEYPILSKHFHDGSASSKHRLEVKLKFKRECTTCISDLSIHSKASNYTLRLREKTFRFNVTINNKGTDPAFSVGLKFNFPPKLELSHVLDENEDEVLCEKDACQNIFNKFKTNQVAQLGVVLNTRSFGPNSANNISVYVTSVNDEAKNTTFDNKIDISFDIKVVADIQLLAAISTQQVLYEGTVKGESAMTSLQDAGQSIEHKYAVLNNGPDILPKANVTLYWPIETLSGKHLLYLVGVTYSSSNVKCVLPKLTNVLHLKSKNRTTPSKLTANTVESNTVFLQAKGKFLKSRQRRDVSNTSVPTETPTVVSESKVLERKKDGITLDCTGGKAKCVSITCTVENLKSGDTSSITVRSRLWEASLLLDYYGDVLTIVSHGMVELGTNVSYISDPNPDNNENELYTVINPVFAAKGKDSGIKQWQIALAAVAGCLLLALLIFALYKVGFFKRKRTSSSTYKKKETDKSLIGKSKNGY